MTPVIVSFVAIVALTAIISLAVLHGQYRAWPAYEWKQRVLHLVAELHGRRRSLSSADVDDPRSLADRLASECFRRHLQSISAHKLDDYPGIGPGTIDRVRGAGCRTLDDLSHYPFESIHGIGPSKAADLRAAVATLVREAQSRFEAGGCPEAEEYRRKLANLTAEARDRAAARSRELAAVATALRSADNLLVAADEVTFWNYLFRRNTTGPSDDVMSRPLPTPTVLPPAVPVAKPVVRAVPPPVPVARPAVARPAPSPAAFPPAPTPPAATPQPTDLFKAELQTNQPGTAPSTGDHPWLPKLVACTRFAFAVAKGDGRIAQAEKKVIRSFLEEQFGHDAVLLRHIDPLMERTESRVPTEADAFADVRTVTTDAERRELYLLAERIADASGGRNQRELDLLVRIAASFGVTTVAPATPQPATTPPFDPQAVLEIEPGTEVTPDLVRRRYALLTDKLCPTKAAGLGPEFAHMAAEKRARLKAAAETLLASFGEPLEKPAPPPPADMRHNPDLDAVFGG